MYKRNSELLNIPDWMYFSKTCGVTKIILRLCQCSALCGGFIWAVMSIVNSCSQMEKQLGYLSIANEQLRT